MYESLSMYYCTFQHMYINMCLFTIQFVNVNGYMNSITRDFAKKKEKKTQ